MAIRPDHYPMKNVTPTDDDLPKEGEHIGQSAEVFAAKAALKTILDALGVDVRGKSLAQITAEAKHATSVAKMMFLTGPVTLAYVDGALDALSYGKPNDIARAVQILKRVHSDIQKGLDVINGDAQAKANLEAGK